MVGSAVGDALGCSFKGIWQRELKIEDFCFSGRWTDDTHMMIGVAESLIENRGLNADHLMKTFIRNWEAEPWRGYGPGPPRIFRLVKSGVSWREAARGLYGGQGSFGNGAAMRVAPVGLFYYDDDVEVLREMAYRSAEVTHTHELGKEGAAVQAYAVALAVKAERESFDPVEFLREIADFARNRVYREKLERAIFMLDEDDRKRVVRGLGNTVEGFNSVPTAIYCFAKNYQSYVGAVFYAVSLGGDTDTIGAMTGAIAGAYHGVDGIPRAWMEKLERFDYIKKLAEKLWELKSSSI